MLTLRFSGGTMTKTFFLTLAFSALCVITASQAAAAPCVGTNDTLSGMSGSDTIFGLGGDDLLSGGSGNDFIDGGCGNDTLDGGLDDDTLILGDGVDTVVLSAGNDVVTSVSDGDFDLLELPASVDFSSLVFANSGDDLQITYSLGTLLILDQLLADGSGLDYVGQDGNAIFDLRNMTATSFALSMLSPGAPVPVPGAALLFGTGLAAGAWRQRRKKAQAAS